MKKATVLSILAVSGTLAACNGGENLEGNTQPSGTQKSVSTFEDASSPKRAPLTIAEVVLNDDSIEGKVFRLYQAAFNREPDTGGLQTWIDIMKVQRWSLEQVSSGFTNSEEFKNLYGAYVSNEVSSNVVD